MDGVAPADPGSARPRHASAAAVCIQREGCRGLPLVIPVAAAVIIHHKRVQHVSPTRHRQYLGQIPSGLALEAKPPIPSLCVPPHDWITWIAHSLGSSGRRTVGNFTPGPLPTPSSTPPALALICTNFRAEPLGRVRCLLHLLICRPQILRRAHVRFFRHSTGKSTLPPPFPPPSGVGGCIGLEIRCDPSHWTPPHHPRQFTPERNREREGVCKGGGRGGPTRLNQQQRPRQRQQHPRRKTKHLLAQASLQPVPQFHT